MEGKRKREFFSDENSGKRRIQSIQTQRTNLGTRAAHIQGGLAEDAVRAEQLLAPFGVPLLEAVRDYARCLELLRDTGHSVRDAAQACADAVGRRRKSLALPALLDRFLADPENKKRSKFYLDDIKKRWRRFETDMGVDTVASEITADRLRQWLHGLEVADVTKGNFHRTVGAVFAWAVSLELVPENVFRKVKKPGAAEVDGVEVFTPEQMRELLKHAHRDWLPVLAIAGFAGLRPEELRRLDWEEVDLEGGHIEVKASKSKTGKRRLVTIAENLRAWLEPYAERQGRIAPANERKMRLAAMAAAQVERWPVDVLRHSFASYHLAEHKKIDETALQLGHTNTKMLFQHYREAVKPDAAHQWWALRPADQGKPGTKATGPKKGKGAKIIALPEAQEAA